MAKSPIIEAITQKVERMMADNAMLRDENLKLSRQRDRLKSENRMQAERIAAMERRIAVLELGAGMSTEGDRKKARARVNRLMREVDKCIALLNR